MEVEAPVFSLGRAAEERTVTDGAAGFAHVDDV